MSKFSVSQNEFQSGFKMTFENGWTVSVQFGKINYISDRENIGDSIDAEIAAWDKDGNWYSFDDDLDGHQNVKGWVKPDEVADFIVKIKSFPSTEADFYDDRVDEAQEWYDYDPDC